MSSTLLGTKASGRPLTMPSRSPPAHSRRVPRYDRDTAELTTEEEITTAGTRLQALLARKKAEEDARILSPQAEHTRPHGCRGLQPAGIG